MDEEGAHRMFRASRVARLATVSPASVPHLVPVVFAIVGDEISFAVDHKPKTTRRLRRLDNIAANGKVSLLVDHYDDDWASLWWVRVDGDAVVADAASADGRRGIDALVAKYPQYADVRPAGPAVLVRQLRWTWWAAA